ncbi:MAG TPA: ABC transporter permease [Mycobacteriales bacterium]|nr:ABC transporter permease [Mycobacteriales bacterium]HWA65975.1 ABC transporter permease [Mycobacteriales bacterium]
MSSAEPQPGEAPALEAPRMQGQTPIEREFTVAERSQARQIIRRFLHHRLAVASAVVLILLFLLAFVGGHFWRYNYQEFTNDLSQAPSWKHPFGTDSNGVDTFAAVLRGTQRSLEIALFVAVVSTIVGAIYGAIAGLYRGALDTVMLRIVDLFLTFPPIAIAAVLGDKYGAKAQGWLFIALILTALQWPYVARVMRGVVLSLREKEFIEAARALGASDRRIIFRHLIPNAAGPLIVTVTVLVAIAILTETALSFIGFGVQFPDTSLGLLVTNAQTAVDDRPWLFYFPGLFIILIVLSINFIGDGLRDAFDPAQTRVRA